MQSVSLFSPFDCVVRISPNANPNPFMARVTGTFVHESGERFVGVPGFYDGDGRMVIRFAPNRLGTWTGTTQSDVPELDGQALPEIDCVPSDAALAHGVLTRDSRNPHRFAWEDGTPFVPLGFECDFLFSYHQSHPEDCLKRLDQLQSRGFNTLVMNVYAHTGFSASSFTMWNDPRPACDECVYGPPRTYVFEGTNEAPEHGLLNVAFFHGYDTLIRELHKRGMVAHIMIQAQNKGVNWPERWSAEDDLYWRYVVSRYQAFGNIVWDVGKECYKLHQETGNHGYALDRMRLIREHDAYRHLVTAHDPDQSSAGGRLSEADKAADFVSDQNHLADSAMYNRDALAKQAAWPAPYLHIEYGYEEGAEDHRTHRNPATTADWRTVLEWTWALYASGAYACYYYSNTAWDLVKFDPEPPGWQRYAYLRKFLDTLPFNEMAPANEAVNRGFCLAKPGDTYFAFLPNGGDVEMDLSPMPGRVGDAGRMFWDAVPVHVLWLDIASGEECTQQVHPAGFRTALPNPLPDRATPCAIRVRV